MFWRRSTKQADREAEQNLARSLGSTALDSRTHHTPASPSNADNEQPRKLTRGAKFIAGYVLIGSWSALGRYKLVGTAIRTGELPPLKAAILLSGLAGSILLFRKSPRAKPVFLVWSALLITSTWTSGATFDSLGERLVSGLLIAGMFLLINREVDRNVGIPKEED